MCFWQPLFFVKGFSYLSSVINTIRKIHDGGVTLSVHTVGCFNLFCIKTFINWILQVLTSFVLPPVKGAQESL